MISRLVALALMSPLIAAHPLAVAQSSQRIQLVQLEAMFAQMRANAPWDADGPLLWGYFFVDASRDRLERAASELGTSGYRVVGITTVDGAAKYRLHVERVELHSPMTLNARNQTLYAFAERRGIASYDGMDVGPAK